jgi:DNA-binding IclR family transcriptional regulator
MTKRSNDERGAALKVLAVLEALSGHAVGGVSNATLATSLDLVPSCITRAMATLIEKGWARKDETTGKFHPTPRMGRVFMQVLADLDRAQQRLDDLKRSFNV